ECLDSILTQSYEPLEIVVVDDGSTDGTATVARRYADRHPNVRLVATPNHGLGAARNRGVSESAGELIAFADSDDTVVAGAYDVMAQALERSGSDFVVGSMQRHDGDGYDEPRWMGRLHARRRLGITVDDCPEILGDVFAWNKMFRRSFWERQGLAFPEGVRYEDQVALTYAYLTAEAFDVVSPPVYNWRIRSDGSAITDRRDDLDDLADRVRTKRTALETVRTLGSREVQAVFREQVLPGDLWRYFAHIPGCSDAYWQTLHEAVREFWRDGAFVRSRLTVPNRLTGWLVGQDRRRDAEAVVEHNAASGSLPIVVANDEVLAALPYWDDPEANVPLDLYRLRPDELGWAATIDAVRIERNSLVVKGSASLGRVDTGDALVRLMLTAGDGSTALSARAAADGFELRVDLGGLLAGRPPDVRDAPRVWRVTVQWETHGLRHEGTFTDAPLGAGASGSIGDAEVEVAFTAAGLSVTARPLAIAEQRRPA
ncbi:MAG: glycosyltransferase family 2 protein, partial [Nocardioidaceae bacterium]